MSDPSVRAWPAALALALLYLVPGLWNLDLEQIRNPDEPRPASCARDMLSGKSWIVPSFNDEPRLKKPPLIYWTLAVAGRAGQAVGLGLVTAFRLVPLLAGLAAVLAAYGLGRRLLSHGAGVVAGLVLLSTFYFHTLTREISIDPLLTGLLACAWYCFVVALGRFERHGEGEGKTAAWLPLLGLYVLLGLVCLAKGPFLTAAFAVLPMAAYFFWERKRYLPETGCPWAWLLLRAGLLWGAPLALLLGFSWNIALAAKGLGAEGEHNLFWENVQRALAGIDHNRGGRMYPWLFYLYDLPVHFLPWALFLIAVLPWLWRGQGSQRRRLLVALSALAAPVLVMLLCGGTKPESSARFTAALPFVLVPFYIWTGAVVLWWAWPQAQLQSRTKLLLCAAVIPFLLMGLAASKRSAYLLPIYPLLALVLAWAWEELFLAEAAPDRPRRVWGVLLGVVAWLAPLLVLAFCAGQFAGLWAALTARAKFEYGFSFRNDELVAGLIAGLGLAVGAVLVVRDIRARRLAQASSQALAIAAVALLAFEVVARPALEQREDAVALHRDLAEVVGSRPLFRLGDSVYETVWYLGRPVKDHHKLDVKTDFFETPKALLLIRGKEYNDPYWAWLKNAVRVLRSWEYGQKSYYLVEPDPASPPRYPPEVPRPAKPGAADSTDDGG